MTKLLIEQPGYTRSVNLNTYKNYSLYLVWTTFCTLKISVRSQKKLLIPFKKCLMILKKLPDIPKKLPDNSLADLYSSVHLIVRLFWGGSQWRAQKTCLTIIRQLFWYIRYDLLKYNFAVQTFINCADIEEKKLFPSMVLVKSTYPQT